MYWSRPSDIVVIGNQEAFLHGALPLLFRDHKQSTRTVLDYVQRRPTGIPLYFCVDPGPAGDYYRSRATYAPLSVLADLDRADAVPGRFL